MPSLSDDYDALTGGFSAADLPWQERMAIWLYNNLRPVQDWAEERKTGAQDLAAPFVNWMMEPIIDPARRAAEGEPNVYADLSSESPMNWQVNPEAVDLAAAVAPALPGAGRAVGAVAEMPGMILQDLAERSIEGIPGVLRGIGPKIYRRPLWAGTQSLQTGEVADPGDLVSKGFTRGRSAELNIPGSSTSEDIMVSNVSFAPKVVPKEIQPVTLDYLNSLPLGEYVGRYGNPDALVAVRHTGDPNKVYNLPPDLFRLGYSPQGTPNAVIKKPGEYQEAEVFGKRAYDPFHPSAGKALEDEQTMISEDELWDMFKDEMADNDVDVDDMDTDEVNDLFNEFYTNYVDNMEGDDEFYSPGVTEGVTPVRGGSPTGTSTSPAPFTDQEMGWINRIDQPLRNIAKAMAQGYNKETGRARFAINELPQHKRVPTLVSALEGIRGNRGTFAKYMNDLVQKLTNSDDFNQDFRDMIVNGIGDEEFAKIREIAQRNRDAHMRFSAPSRFAGDLRETPYGRDLTAIADAIDRGELSIDDVGRPEQRQAWREYNETRNELFEALRNAAYKLRR